MRQLLKKHSEQGFSLIEVLVAILATTAFLVGTLQLVGVSTLYKMLAKQEANANLWIQADLEEVQALAATLTYNNALCNPTTITTTNNYASVLKTAITSSTTLPGSTSKALLGSNGKLYQMNRTYGTITTTRPNALEITYAVVDTGASNSSDQDINKSSNATVATSTTLVIPPASFQCP